MHRPHHRRRCCRFYAFVAVLLLHAVALVAARPARASAPVPPAPIEAGVGSSGGGLGGPSVVTDLQWSQVERAPYPKWKEHTGPAETAVVFVRATFTDPDTGDKQVREGSGFVIRCDGFVLVPSELLAPWVRAFPNGATRQTGVKDKQIVLTFAGADGEIPPPQVVPQPRHFFPNQVPYAAAKVNGLHFRGLSMLAAANVRPGMAVRLVYARPKKDAPGQAEAVTLAASVGEAEKDGGFRFAGDAPPPRVPPGTVVVDAASGLAIGIVPGGAPPGQGERVLPEKDRDPVVRLSNLAPAPGFVTFARFHEISNAVGLLPAPANNATGGGGAATTAGTGNPGGGDDMVWVPGGPTAMPLRWTSDYAMLWGYWITCTPGFYIDKREVTNDEYREFLVATKYRPLPQGWNETELANPRRTPDLPVTGVMPEGAQAYASWRGKRLPTPVEWSRACRGAGGAWIGAYASKLAQASAQMEQALAVFGEAEATEVNLIRQDYKQRNKEIQSDAAFVSPELARIAEERRVFLGEAARAFNTTLANYLLVVPAGSRSEDESVWGVRDVAANVPELVLPNLAQRPVELAPKILAPRYDPDRVPRWAEAFADEIARRAEQFTIAARGAGRPSLAPERAAAMRNLGASLGGRLADTLLLPAPALDPAVAPDARAPSAPSTGSALARSRETALMFGAGFRCAR